MGGYAGNSGMYPSGGRSPQQFMSGKGQGMQMQRPMAPQYFGGDQGGGPDENVRRAFEGFGRDERAGYRAAPAGKGQGVAPPQYGSQAVSPEAMQRLAYAQMASNQNAVDQPQQQPPMETAPPLDRPQGVGFTEEQWSRRQNDAMNQIMGQLAGGLGAYAPSGMRGMPQQYGGYSGKGQQNQNFPQQFQQPMAQPRPQMTPYGYPGRSQRQFQQGMSGKGQY